VETKIKKKPGPKPRHMTPPTWTPELAYACGLMASDGCLYSDGRHLNLTSLDIEQLETFKRIMKLNVKIGYKSRSSSDNRCRQIQFGDVNLYRWFISIGITPRKSRTISKVLVPEEYFFDFLRGEFDGDGTSNAYWDTRWRSSVCIYISFASASTEYLSWIQSLTKKLAGISGVIAPGGTIFSLKFAKNESKTFFSKMYHNENIPFLKRKKDKLERQFHTDLMAKCGHFPEMNDRKHVIKIA